mmetsp:Transcript_3136/g.8323  ORF Transcript_3136/g.8323 Transcript_3136/m.8323 type:complete len:368 (-) Transcript_3136:650-1753(-)
MCICKSKKGKTFDAFFLFLLNVCLVYSLPPLLPPLLLPCFDGFVHVRAVVNELGPHFVREAVVVDDLLLPGSPGPQGLVLLLLVLLLGLLDRPRGDLLLPQQLQASALVHPAKNLHLFRRPCNHLVDLGVGVDPFPDVLNAALEEVAEHVVPLLVRRALVEHARLDDLVVDVRLLPRPLDDDLLDGAHRHEGNDFDLPLLSDAVRAVLGLLVHLRVPVAVEEDHRVGRLQVEPEPARPRRQHEEKDLRSRRVELGQEQRPLVRLGLSVQPKVLVLLHLQVHLQQVHGARHLGEEQHAVARRLQLGQDSVQELELAARADQLHGVLGLVRRVHAVEEEVRVNARLAQLHGRIHERLALGVALWRLQHD